MSVIYKKFTDTSFEACYEVHSPQDGMRLDQYLQIYFPSFSRQQVKEKIKNKEVFIQGRPGKHKPNTTVYDKERVVVFVHKTEHEDEWWKGEKLELETKPKIIFEDDDIVVISKPPYMSTHPTGKHLFNCATVFLESLTGKTAHSVHRLDRETSGALILAKHPQAAKKYTMYFEENRVAKCYFFIAVNKPGVQAPDQLHARENLDTGGEGLKRVVIGYHPEGSDTGKFAQTDFRILHRHQNYLIGLAFPYTGRQHQIRVHALAHGFPLLGDKIYYGSYEMFQRFKDLYATDEDYDFMELTRHALHAFAVNTPYDSERKTFYAPLPKDLKDWMNDKLTISIDEIIERATDSAHGYFNKVDK